jgi:hypothetical protein
MSVRVFYDILNQKGTPAMYTDTLANRPTYGFAGRLFISTDSGQIFEDTGTAWTLVADAGVGGGTLSSVCLNGNTTATGIVITAGGLSTDSITNTGNTAGSVLFAGASGLESQSNATFFWDNTNKRLGIGNASPGAPLDIHGTGTQVQLNGTGANNSYIVFQNAGVSKWRIGNLYNAGANSFEIYDVLNATTRLTILNTGATTLNGTFTATSLIKSGGTASQYLMADGSVTTLTNPVTGTGTTNTLPKFTGASTIGNSNVSDTGSLITLGSSTLITGSTTASSAIARGTYLTPTLTASANSDVLIGLDINPTYNSGGFSGITYYGLRILTRNNAQILLGTTSQAGLIAFARGTDGSNVSSIGYNTAASLNDFVINSGGGSAILGFIIAGNRSGQFFNNGNFTLQNGGTFTDAGFRLDVQGTARITGAASFSSSITATQGNFFQTATSGQAIILKNRNSNQQWGFVVDVNAVDDKYFGLYDVTNSAYRFVVSNGGNVLINTTTDAGYRLDVNGTFRASNILSGTYTPTLTNIGNVSSSSASVCQYMRVGNVVTVSGRITITATSVLTATYVRLSLPVTSGAFTSYDQAGGTGYFQNGSAFATCNFSVSNITLFTVDLTYYTGASTPVSDFYFSFTYQII